MRFHFLSGPFTSSLIENNQIKIKYFKNGKKKNETKQENNDDEKRLWWNADTYRDTSWQKLKEERSRFAEAVVTNA